MCRIRQVDTTLMMLYQSPTNPCSFYNMVGDHINSEIWELDMGGVISPANCKLPDTTKE